MKKALLTLASIALAGCMTVPREGDRIKTPKECKQDVVYKEDSLLGQHELYCKSKEGKQLYYRWDGWNSWKQHYFESK